MKPVAIRPGEVYRLDSEETTIRGKVVFVRHLPLPRQALFRLVRGSAEELVLSVRYPPDTFEKVYRWPLSVGIGLLDHREVAEAGMVATATTWLGRGELAPTGKTPRRESGLTLTWRKPYHIVIQGVMHRVSLIRFARDQYCDAVAFVEGPSGSWILRATSVEESVVSFSGWPLECSAIKVDSSSPSRVQDYDYVDTEPLGHGLQATVEAADD